MANLKIQQRMVIMMDLSYGIENREGCTFSVVAIVVYLYKQKILLINKFSCAEEYND